MLLVYQYSNSFYFRFHISRETWNKNHVHQLNTFFKIIFELWRSIAQAVYETFFCHSMTELRATYFMKFGLRKLSQLTLTYFLRSVPDIQKPTRQFTVLENCQHINITTYRDLFFICLLIWKVQSFSVKVVGRTWDISKTESTSLGFFHMSWY